MTVHQLIYASQPFGFDAATLGGILVAARRNNRRDGVTGALICRADIYLQLLEGPQEAVEAAFTRIVRDDRHQDVVRLCAGDVAGRVFPAWDMADDPAKSWLWSPAEVAAGRAASATPDEAIGVFRRLATEVSAAQPPACPAAANP